MAGPSIISGQQGAINLGSQPGNPSQDLLQIISVVQKIQQEKQQSASERLKTMLELNQEQGIPFDEKEFIKTAGDAGLPIKEITGAVTAQNAQHVGKVLKGNGQGAQSAFQLPSNSAEKNPGGGVGPDMKPLVTDAKAVPTGGASPQGFVDQLMRAGTKNWQSAQLGKEQAATLASHVMGLKERILAKSEAGENYGQELGAMAAITGQQVNLAQLNYADATPKERSVMAGIAAGQETVADKERRISTMGMDLFKSGRFNTPEDAMKSARGEQVPMKTDLGRMVQETQLTNELVAVTGDPKLAKEVGQKMANGASLMDALPKDIAPLIMKEYELHKRQLDIAQESLGVQKGAAAENVRAHKAGEALQLSGQKLQKYGIDMQAATNELEISAKAKELVFKLQDKSAEQANARFERMVQAQKMGVEIPAEMQQQMVNDLAARSGMEVKDVSGVWNWLVGGKTFAFTGDKTKDANMLNSAIGAPQVPNRSSEFTPVGGSKKSSQSKTLPELEVSKPKRYRTSIEQLGAAINPRIQK